MLFCSAVYRVLGIHIVQQWHSQGFQGGCNSADASTYRCVQSPFTSRISAVPWEILSNLAKVTEPLYHLTKKDVKWNRGPSEQAAFTKLKEMLTADTVLAHFDPSLTVGISCDALETGLGAVLFHRYPDGSERRPVANVSKTLSDTQRRYRQIQKEALAIVFALHKFHQFLYGHQFILVTDHKPLLSLFGPNKATPALAANRLAHWALLLNQYNNSIEYRRTKLAFTEM